MKDFYHNYGDKIFYFFSSFHKTLTITKTAEIEKKYKRKKNREKEMIIYTLLREITIIPCEQRSYRHQNFFKIRAKRTQKEK